MKLIHLILLALTILLFSCQQEPKEDPAKTPVSDEVKYSQQTTEEERAIIDKYVDNCADKYRYNSHQYQKCLDMGIEKDSTIAYLWQQKAMPYFKVMKYEIGMEYVDKAVKYDPQQYLPYRAFIKCIFAKTYKSAVTDFQKLIEDYGNSYVMDHTYKFYLALSYLQLNKFKKAEQIFKKDIEVQREDNWIQHLDLFYYGISLYEQQKWEDAITQFDKAIDIYPEFSDAKFYKYKCLRRLGKKEQAYKLYIEAKKLGEAGNTINEANSVYERYPYQKRW
jgi:tetratricopeptide (TPR) repeat protein